MRKLAYPLQEQWKPIRAQLRDMLASEPLDDLAKRVIDKRNEMSQNIKFF